MADPDHHHLITLSKLPVIEQVPCRAGKVSVGQLVRVALAYRKVSNIRRTKSPNLNVPRLVLQFYLPKLLMPGIKSRMKM